MKLVFKDIQSYGQEPPESLSENMTKAEWQ